MVPQGPTPGNASLPQSSTVSNGNASAVATAPIRAALRDLLGFDSSDWADSGLERIKQRTVRTIYRGQLGDIDVHIKLFRANKLSDRARDNLRGPRGERECRNLLRAQELSLPAAEPLAHGLARDGDDLRSFVITRTIPTTEPFTFAAAPIAQERAGALLRQLHDAGAAADDLHPGNLLIDAEDQPWLIDLTSFRHGGDMDVKRRTRALAFFCQQLDGGALDPHAKRFLSAYLDTDETWDPEGFASQLASATRRWRAAALPKFGRRSSRDCRHTATTPKRRGQPRWFWHRPGDEQARRAQCAAFAEEPGEPTKSGRRGAVWLTAPFVCKKRDRGAARKLWRASYWLLFAGADAPRPIALRLSSDEGLVFVERIDQPSLLDELQQQRLDEGAIARAAAALGNSVGRLHAHGLRNRDLKFENLVRIPNSDRIAMVDLDGVRNKAAIDARGTGADLGRLLAAFRAAGAPGGTATIRRFFRAWLRAHRNLLERPPWRRIVRRAEQRAGEWAAAHRK